jgi:hypothetical protein
MDRMSFVRGLRHRSAAAPVLAAALLAALLAWMELGPLRSGFYARLPLPLLYAAPDNDDHIRVVHVLEEYAARPPLAHALFTFGGSIMREALPEEATIQSAVREATGVPYQVLTLETNRQTFAENIAELDHLPLTDDGLLILNVDMWRFGRPASEYRQVADGLRLPLRSEALAAFLAANDLGRWSDTLALPKFFVFLQNVWKLKGRELIAGKLLRREFKKNRTDPVPHPFMRKENDYLQRIAMLPAELAQWQEFNERALSTLMATAHERGLRVVLLESPYNPEFARRSAYRRVFEQDYSPRIRKIASRFGVPYWDFITRLPLTDADFMDYAHLMPRGRDIVLAALARELAALDAVAGAGPGPVARSHKTL